MDELLMAIKLRTEALLPQEMATQEEYLGERKANLPILTMFTLAILSGAFIGLGEIFATHFTAGYSGVLPCGVVRVLTGFVIYLGSILIIVGGVELFTGNNLVVTALANRKVCTVNLLVNWIIVYLGNLVGSIATAGLIFASQQYIFGNGLVGQTGLGIANSKVHRGFLQGITLGMLCDILACLAMWLTFSARSAIDKITAFIAAGFKHNIANTYFLPLRLLIKNYAPTFAATTNINLSGLTGSTFPINNLVSVTIENIIGNSIFVIAIFRSIFLGKNQPQPLSIQIR